MKIISVTFTLVIIYTLFIIYLIHHSEAGNSAPQEAKASEPLITGQQLSYSPDGKYLVFLRSNVLKIFNIKSGKTMDIKDDVTSFSVSPDSRFISLLEKNNKVEIISLDNNKNYYNLLKSF